jgi:hypothetical protein
LTGVGVGVKVGVGVGVAVGVHVAVGIRVLVGVAVGGTGVAVGGLDPDEPEGLLVEVGRCRVGSRCTAGAA